jgi:peptidyl-prolyl cis-trans isomerase A (cyclophilin A)
VRRRVINVTRSLAPLGSDRLYALVQDNFFTIDDQPAAFFRVVPQFVVQFGISGLPIENQKWNTVIPDDPVIGSNTIGTLTFATAGPSQYLQLTFPVDSAG